MERKRKRFYFLAVLLVLSWAGPAEAATVVVEMSNFKFTPKDVTVSVGDTVMWVNRGGSHDIQSNAPLFKSPPPPVQSFSFTFQDAGTVSYRCNPHASFGMVGTVTVEQAVVPAEVSLVSPQPDEIFLHSEEVQLQAGVTEGSAKVVQVEFFEGTTSLGVAVEEPFAISRLFEPGEHTVFAEAKDEEGGSAMSGAVSFTVYPPLMEPVLSQPAFEEDGAFTFMVTGTAGVPHVVEVSSEVGAWIDLKTITPTEAEFQVRDSQPATIRFYRVSVRPPGAGGGE